MRKYLLTLLLLLLPAVANAACTETGGIPFTTNGCLHANDLNSAFAFNPGTTPPANAQNQGVQYGTLWLDTSTSPNTLRQCVTLNCSTIYSSSQWTIWGTVSIGGVFTPASTGNANVRIVTSGTSDTIVATDATIVWLSATTGNKIETFPVCNSFNKGETHYVVDGQKTAYIYPISLKRSDTSTFYTINTNGGGAGPIRCDGTDWRVIATAYGLIPGGSILGALPGTASQPSPVSVQNFSAAPPVTSLAAVLALNTATYPYTSFDRTGVLVAGDAPTLHYVLESCSGLTIDNKAKVIQIASGECAYTQDDAVWDQREWGADPLGVGDSLAALNACFVARIEGACYKEPNDKIYLSNVPGPPPGGVGIDGQDPYIGNPGNDNVSLPFNSMGAWLFNTPSAASTSAGTSIGSPILQFSGSGIPAGWLPGMLVEDSAKVLIAAQVDQGGKGYHAHDIFALTDTTTATTNNTTASGNNTLHFGVDITGIYLVYGGTGGSNGPVTITGTTGAGTKFQATGTISGGVLQSSLTLTVAGNYTTPPTNNNAELVSGGSLVGAYVGLVTSPLYPVNAGPNSIVSDTTAPSVIPAYTIVQTVHPSNGDVDLINNLSGSGAGISDTITFSDGGNALTAAQIYVDSVDGNGAITALEIYRHGVYTKHPDPNVSSAMTFVSGTAGGSGGTVRTHFERNTGSLYGALPTGARIASGGINRSLNQVTLTVNVCATCSPSAIGADVGTIVTGETIQASAGFLLSNGRSFVKQSNIFPAGMTFPQTDSVTIPWTGTAVVATNDDAVLEWDTILGFDLGVDAAGQRLHASHLAIDAQSGARVNDIGDTFELADWHLWPYATIGSSVPGTCTWALRTGTGVTFNGAVFDLSQTILSLGHDINFNVAHAANITGGPLWSDSIVPCSDMLDPVREGVDLNFYVAEFNALVITYGGITGVHEDIGAGNTAKFSSIHQGFVKNNGVELKTGDLFVATPDYDYESPYSVGNYAFHKWSNASFMQLGPGSIYYTGKPDPVCLEQQDIAGYTTRLSPQLITVNSPSNNLIDTTCPGFLRQSDLTAAATMNFDCHQSLWQIDGNSTMSQFNGCNSGESVMLLFSGTSAMSNAGNLLLPSGGSSLALTAGESVVATWISPTYNGKMVVKIHDVSP